MGEISPAVKENGGVSLKDEPSPPPPRQKVGKGFL